MHTRFVILPVFVSLLYMAAAAQTERPLEVGVQFTVMRVSPLGEGAGSVGARASYDLPFKKLTIAPEIEFNYFPQNPSGNFGETQLLAGARAGFKDRPLRVFREGPSGAGAFWRGRFCGTQWRQQ